MVIDIRERMEEMRRRRSWAASGLVRSIDPSGEQFRIDDWGRLMRFDDYGLGGAFGWQLDGQLAVNHRSAASAQKKLKNPAENGLIDGPNRNFLPIILMISMP